MNPSDAVRRLAMYLSWTSALVLILLPFHAFITVWFSSFLGHYTLLRLWKEFLLIIIVCGAIAILLADKDLRKKLFSFWPARLIGIYIFLLLIWGFVALAKGDVSSKAMWYGLLVNLRFLIFFVVVAVVAAKSDLLGRIWPKVLLLPAALVSFFAILQFLVLPYDFLRHFGYGQATISPYETINHNLNHLRVVSTLRGANPLGVYLILPISAFVSLLLVKKLKGSLYGILGIGLVLALVFSFSRSAWIGAIVSVLVLLWLCLKKPRHRALTLRIAIALAAVAALSGFALRNNTTFENIIFHTDHTSVVATSSNEGHLAAFKQAVGDIVNQPLGRGVGTAGPESVYNLGQTRIAENYYLQIGQEVGIAGIIIFVGVNILVGIELWRRQNNQLAKVLLSSLVGITFVNLVSHAWTDDTLAYLWWGLAGICLSSDLKIKKNKQTDDVI